LQVAVRLPLCGFACDLVDQILDLPFDEIQRIDAPHRSVRRARLFTLRIGQRFERLEEASPRVCAKHPT
jgi:hypothetical protein